MREVGALGSTPWAASIGGGTHASYTQIGRGESQAALSEWLASLPLDIPPIGDRIPKLCPKMKASGICRLPSCPYIHEVCQKRKPKSAMLGAGAKQFCKDVPCRYALVLGSCTQGSKCSYCHERVQAPEAQTVLSNASIPGPVPNSGRTDGSFSEAPPEVPMASWNAETWSRKRPPSAARSSARRPASASAASVSAAASRPSSALPSGRSGRSGGGSGTARSTGVASTALLASTAVTAAEAAAVVRSGVCSARGFSRRSTPSMTYVGRSRSSIEPRRMLSGCVPRLDLCAGGVLFRGGC
mmetsp:Transcript_127296/g.407169  ORF Transcript_127296/g.407169 Transcript_127296/m.407169 type:complete len:299 (+) Transcript_127296:110-1006(+)